MRLSFAALLLLPLVAVVPVVVVNAKDNDPCAQFAKSRGDGLSLTHAEIDIQHRYNIGKG